MSCNSTSTKPKVLDQPEWPSIKHLGPFFPLFYLGLATHPVTPSSAVWLMSEMASSKAYVGSAARVSVFPARFKQRAV
jgi:hypothetical protein